MEEKETSKAGEGLCIHAKHFAYKDTIKFTEHPLSFFIVLKAERAIIAASVLYLVLALVRLFVRNQTGGKTWLINPSWDQ